MRIIIIGAGKMGRYLCQILSQEDHELTLIERDERRLKRVAERFDLRGIEGDGTSFSVLEEAGVEQADVFISLTERDEVNFTACAIAKQLGAKFTISRIRDQDYTDHGAELRRAFGISLLINPELLAAREIARMIQFPAALSVEPFAFNRVNLVEILVPEGHPYVGQDLIYFRQQLPGALVCMIERQLEAMIPRGRTVIEAGDRLFITGTYETLRKVYKVFTSTKGAIRSLLIVGGGDLATRLLSLLQNSSLDIKVIELNEKRAERIARKFPKVHVVLGDGTNQEVLRAENIDAYDCTLALTGIDEENLLVSLFSIASDVPRNITKVNRLELLKVIDKPELQSIITPYELGATEINRVVRSLNQDETSDMEAMYRIVGGQVEVLQFEVKESSKVCEAPLHALELKTDVLIGYIVRGRDVIVPTGRDRFMVGDHVIVVAKDQTIVNLDDILR